MKPPNTLNREISLTSRPVQGQRSGHRSRAKGDCIEREIVSRHAAIGIKAFIAYTHAGDHWPACRDYVLKRLGSVVGKEPLPHKLASTARINSESQAELT